MNGYKSIGLLLTMIAMIVMLMAPSIMAKCIKDGRKCKKDGSMGICCSNFCLQQQGENTGVCRKR